MMNERIKELAEQAGFCHDVNNGIYLCALMHMEKFAELLIRECAEVAEDYDGAHYVGTTIKQHFGVEK